MVNKGPSEISILFVDDEQLLRNSFSRDLRAEHFTVTAVASGGEAIRALESGRYDLVITDLVMPGVDGFAVLKAVKRLAPQTSVIILTGYGDLRAAIDALRLGADDFAMKPCEIEELVFRIGRCLEKQSLMQMLAVKNRRLEEEMLRRQVVESQLSESERRFHLALDAASNGVWDHDLATDAVYFSETWCRTLGYEAGDEIRDEHAFINLLHPDDRQRVLALYEAHQQGASPRYEAEYRIRAKTGGWRWMLSRGQVAVRDEQGRALRMVGTFTEITRMKELEAELQRTQLELEQRVEARTVELTDANIALTVLLKKREQDRATLNEQVLSSTTHLVEPFLDRLQESRLSEEQRVLVDILRTNIRELTSPFASKFSTRLVRLTPVELQIANMVKLGKRSKEIAEILRLSPGTVNVHRKNIRKKLDISHQKTNLQTVLSLNS